MEHLDLAGIIASTPMNWNLPLFDQQDAIYLSSSRQMLEPILEETSEDEEHAQNSWNPYEQTTTSFWSGSASESDTGSVIRIEINKDSDSISERDFACPAKRARRSDEFLFQNQTTQYYSNQTQPCSLDDTVILRRQHQSRPEYVSESSMTSLERFLAFEAAARDSFGAGNSLQRSSTGSSRRFEDFCIDSDSVSYQSLSRSSSLIQFESLERQLQLQDQHASMSSLGNSSPSVLSFDGALNTGSNSGSNSGNNSRRGSQSSLLKQRYESSDGRLHQTYYDLDKLNFDDDGSNIAQPHKQLILLFGGNNKIVEGADEVINIEAKSDSESSSSSRGSGNSVLNSTKPSAEDLSDAATSGKFMRITSFQRGGKNSAENLSEDSGYCEPSNLRRSKSKSIPKNFEKFCEEEEEYGQFNFEHDYRQQDAQINSLVHSNTNKDKRDRFDESLDDDGSVDMCQPKINDVTFIVMESAAHTDAVDRNETVILPSSEYPSSPPPPLETSFDAFMYTNPPTTSTACVINSPTRDTTSTTTTMSVNIERTHRPIAHSPSPVASDISARSSTSTTPSTCASATSFTWYTPIQMQRNEKSKEEAPLISERGIACREFSSASFSLRNSLPDLREAYGSISENTLFFSNSQRPTNGNVLEHTLKSDGEEIGGELLEAAANSIGGRVVFEEICRRQSSSSSSSESSSSTAPEHSDVTTDSPLNTPESARRRRSVGVFSGAASIVESEGRAFVSELPLKKRVSSVPSELHKIGRKKRTNTRCVQYNQFANTKTLSSSSETNSEIEDNFNVDLNVLRRCCSWSERRHKFQETGKRRPASLFGYMNASYQDLTQLDYATETENNKALLKRASDKMSEKRKSSTLPDYEHIICKGNFLLDELSEIYDRNASILNDRPADMLQEFDGNLEDHNLLAAVISQKPLHSPRPPPRHRKHSHSSISDAEASGDQNVQHVQLTIRKPPARHRNKSNTNSLTSEPSDIPCFVKTFDQDPTNLRTSYAQSLEKCNFDAKELNNSELSAQQQARPMAKRRFHPHANNAKKKNLVSSTPNLNAYDHDAEGEEELEDEIFISSAHTSMHQLPQGGASTQKPLGILLPAGSRTSFSKEVSFCPVVSKYSWQEQSSEECNDQTITPQPQDENAKSTEKSDQMFSENFKEKIFYKENSLHNDDGGDDDDDDLLCNDIDAKLAYNTKENEVIADKQAVSERFLQQLKELNHEESYTNDLHEMRMCKRFIEELREHELIEESKKNTNRRNSTELQRPTTPTTQSPNIVTSTKLVTSAGEEKTTTIITKRLVPNTSTEALASSESCGALNVEVSHKTTFVSGTTASPECETNETKLNVSVQNIKSKTGHAPRPLSIQLPILSEPPVNRAHHILYASQQMLDNFQKREREAELQEQQQTRLKAVSANNISGGAISGTSDTMSKQQVSMESQNSINNNNDLNKMKNKFKADEKHPNSKGFLSRFAHGLRFSLRRNKKKQLQKDQQQQQEQQSKPEFVPELQFNVGKDNNKKEKEIKPKSKTLKSNNVTKISTGKRGNTPDIIHIPLKGPLPAGSRSSTNTTVDSSAASSSVLNNSNVSNASTINIEYSLQNGATIETPTVDIKATNKAPMKLVTGKPPLPKQPPPPRTSSLPQNSGHAHNNHYEQKQQQNAPAVGTAKSFVSQTHQPTIGLPIQTYSDSCEDFLAAERSYYYDDFKNQLNSGMHANGCTLGTSPNGGAIISSPSRASVSQKTQMFNNMQRAAAAPVSQHHNGGKIGLIETNLDTHETVITGKTRSLVDIGPSQLKFVNAGGKRLNLTSTGAGGVGVSSGIDHGDNVLIYDDDDDSNVADVMNVHGGGNVVVVKTTTPAGQIASVRRPHKSMEFLLDKENQKNVLPPENELQKSHEQNPAALSEHQLRIQASLQRLNIPDWFRQYNQTQTPEGCGVSGTGSTYKPGNFTRKRTQESGRWAGLNSKTTSLSSLGSQRSDRSPLLLSPSAHSHHGGQTTISGNQQGPATSVYSTAGTGSSGGAFSRWSTSHLNSSQTSPSVSQRGSFSRGGPINSSFMSVASSGINNSIRNSFRQPYLGWRSTEKLSQRTAHERLASSMLAQQQRTSPTQRTATAANGSIAGLNSKLAQPVTPEIQSSIKEVTSAIVHYVNDQTNPQRSRSTSPNSRKCWLESSFVGIRPLDSPQTPVIETAGTAFSVAASVTSSNLINNSSNFNYNNLITPATVESTRLNNTIGTGITGTTSSSIGLTTNAANVLRMNGLSLSGGGESAILI